MDEDAGKALDVAARALARRDRSRHAVRERLAAAGVDEDEVDAALERLTRAGFLDDARLARRLVSSLAERGLGDAAIRERLQAEGIAAAECEDALQAIPAEERRAVDVAAREAARGPRRLAAYLARRGFGDDAVDAAMASLDASGRPKVR